MMLDACCCDLCCVNKQKTTNKPTRLIVKRVVQPTIYKGAVHSVPSMRGESNKMNGGDDEAVGNNNNKTNKRVWRVLNWRLDPEESYSDFSIEVVYENAKGEETSDTYHVHKNILGFGEKSSGYFEALFASATAEALSNKSTIQFHPLAAKAFPQLLDYIYDLDEPELTPENSATLFHLADYLQVDSLRSKVLEFWERIHLNDAEFMTCFEHAATFHIKELREMVVKKCCGDIAIDSPLMEGSGVQFWVDVQSHMMESSSRVPARYFRLIAEFCMRHKNQLDVETFSKLVESVGSCLRLHFDASLKLLEVEKAVLPAVSDGTAPSTRLHECCVKSLALEWSRLNDSAAANESLENLSPLLLSEVRLASLQEAREEIDVLKSPLPTSITVTGAGISSVNGVYTRNDILSTTGPEYCMHGEWNHCPSQFAIVRCVGYDGYSTWYITIVASEVQHDEEDFYRASPFVNEAVSSFPRKTGWQVVGNGVEPAPTLSFNFEGNNDN